MLKVSIDPADLATIKDFKKRLDSFAESIAVMQGEIVSLLNIAQTPELEYLRPQILSPVPKTEGLPISNSGYRSGFTWKQKTRYIIERCGDPVTTTEIADTICSWEPNLDRKRVVASVSSVLSSNQVPPDIKVGENERGVRTFSKS